MRVRVRVMKVIARVRRVRVAEVNVRVVRVRVQL